MADIFVSYRRDDSQWSAGRINDKLASEFGGHRVFFDTVTIEPGEDFVEVLGNKVGGCRVLLAVIGPNWLDMLERRLGEHNDFVRIEISEALKRGVRVVPVLIDGALPLPEARLPDDLKPLARRNAIWVRAQTFAPDSSVLVEFLKRHLDGGTVPQAGPTAGAPEVLRQSVPGSISIIVGPLKDKLSKQVVPGSGKTEWFKDLPEGPEMVVIPAGEFLMGSPTDEIGRWDDGREGPQHGVRLAKPFAVGRFAVTVGEFTAFVEATGHQMPDKMWTFENDDWKERENRSFRNPGFAQSARNPVVGVNWEDAKAYAIWLSQKTGHSYRLLSEAEWEYAARAGSTSPFWWGDPITPAQANYDGNHVYGSGKKGEYRKRTVSVDSFEPNLWGLYQVHGNVWEWCEDCWNSSYRGAPDDGSPWTKGDMSSRVLRGGSWGSIPQNLRSADRYNFQPDLRNYIVGFRVARTL